MQGQVCVACATHDLMMAKEAICALLHCLCTLVLGADYRPLIYTKMHEFSDVCTCCSFRMTITRLKMWLSWFWLMASSISLLNQNTADVFLGFTVDCSKKLNTD